MYLKLNKLIPGKWYSQDGHWQYSSFGKFTHIENNEFCGIEAFINNQYISDEEFQWINENKYTEVSLETLIQYLTEDHPD